MHSTSFPKTEHRMTLDLISVADFRGPQRLLFLWRALFQIASWLESGQQSSGHTFHLVCIGEPEPCLQHLAGQAGIQIHSRQPRNSIPLEQCSGRTELEHQLLAGMDNKFQGLTVPPTRDAFILMDVDVFFVRPLSGAVLLPERLGAAPAHAPHFPKTLWRQFADALDCPLPQRHIPSLRHELGLGLREEEYPGQAKELDAMVPYYNGGIVLAPWESPVVQDWPELTHRLLQTCSHLPTGTSKTVADVCDQVALSLALEKIHRETGREVTLSGVHHATFHHLGTGRLRWLEVQLYHDNPYSLYEFAKETRKPSRLLQQWKSTKRAMRWLSQEPVRQNAQTRHSSFWKTIPQFLARQRYLDRLIKNWIYPELKLNPLTSPHHSL